MLNKRVDAPQPSELQALDTGRQAITVRVCSSSGQRKSRLTASEAMEEGMKTLATAARNAISHERRKQLRRASAKMHALRPGSVLSLLQVLQRGFKAHRLIPRSEARCPICGSLERHRLMTSI